MRLWNLPLSNRKTKLVISFYMFKRLNFEVFINLINIDKCVIYLLNYSFSIIITNIYLLIELLSVDINKKNIFMFSI